MQEVIIFGAFGVLQVAFHFMHKAHAEGSVWYKVKHSHYLVLAAHPVVSHTIQDYAIHIVIYSGKIIGGH
jgi:hypothetical protein